MDKDTRRLFDVLKLSFCVTSGVLSFWAMLQLRSHASAHPSLFRQQMVALCGTNVVLYTYRSVLQVLLSYHVHGLPYGYLSFVLAWLELSTCMLEVHISLGFCAATRRRATFTEHLRHLMPLCFVFAMAASFAGRCYIEVDSPRRDVDIFCRGCGAVWASTMLVSCGVSSLCYLATMKLHRQNANALTIVHSERRDVHLLVVRRAFLRGASYLASFLFTSAPISIISLFMYDAHGSAVAFLSITFYLNGALNSSLYVFWRSSFGLPPRPAPEPGEADDVTDSVRSFTEVSNYFDLDNSVWELREQRREQRRQRRIERRPQDSSAHLSSTESGGDSGRRFTVPFRPSDDDL